MKYSLKGQNNFILLALRDFFTAKSTVQMSEAYHSLSHDDLCMPHNIDWAESQNVFKKLFIEPEPLIAPLYASYYLEIDPSFRRQSALRMKKLMREMGLSLTADLSMLEDDLALELGVWVRLDYLMQQENTEEFEHSVEQAKHWLICEHMAIWIPKFAQCTLKANDVAINYVVSCLQKCVEDEKIILMKK